MKKEKVVKATSTKKATPIQKSATKKATPKKVETKKKASNEVKSDKDDNSDKYSLLIESKGGGVIEVNVVGNFHELSKTIAFLMTNEKKFSAIMQDAVQMAIVNKYKNFAKKLKNPQKQKNSLHTYL
jgi:hypothetical protein